MMKRMLAVAMLGVAIFGLTAFAILYVPEITGTFSFWTEFDPVVGQFDAFDLDMDVAYTIGTFEVVSDTTLVMPAIWVWQGFTGTWTTGSIDTYGHMLFGGSTADYLYGEWIAELTFGAIFFEIHGAYLGSSVLGGPAGGWAVRGSGVIGAFDLTSVTEFGAHIEDGDFAGITIVHALTGLERHYSTDPRPYSVDGCSTNFTGQKLTVGLFDICNCAEIEAELYITCKGFSYASLSAADIKTPQLPWLAMDAELVFELETKTLTVAPRLELGDILCFTLYGELDVATSTQFGGFVFPALELVCELGPVTVREVSILDLCEMCLTTEGYGSRVVDVANALANGWDYYPDYWEMLSIAYGGDACCEGEFTFLLNVYFDEDSASLFDWAMTYARVHIPMGEQLGFTFALKATELGAETIAFGIDFSW